MTTKKSTTRKGKQLAPVPVAKKARSRARAERVVKTVAAMTPEQRQRFMNDSNRLLNESAPTLKSVSSDLFVLLLVVGKMFIKKYYPGADHATFHVSFPRKKNGEYNNASVMLPILNEIET
jgi:hypothetical protein